MAPDARPADRTPLGKTFRRAEILRLKGERDRLARRLAFAEEAQDAAARRSEELHAQLVKVCGRIDILETGR
jgi:hypothetical protein